MYKSKGIMQELQKIKVNKDTLTSSDSNLFIGDIFTPTEWGIFAIERFGFFEKWLSGYTVFDPTMGEGNLLEAFILLGISKKLSVNELPIHNLFGNELNTIYYQNAIAKFKQKYGIDLSSNFTNKDIFVLKPRKYNLILGNPPWQNFVDLPEEYREKIKPFFLKYGLVKNRQSVLLGGSRIDISAVIIQLSIKDFLKENGEAVFFAPLSIFLNDGANKNFRLYQVDKTSFKITAIYDFNDVEVFKNVSTRYGLFHLIRNKETTFPIPYYRYENNQWQKYFASTVFHKTDPLSISKECKVFSKNDLPKIIIKKESTPRQGVNTCGANDVFFFDNYQDIDDSFAVISNKVHKQVILPKKFIFPLITAKNFYTDNLYDQNIISVSNDNMYKWVLLPYNQNGKPLDLSQLQQYHELYSYLKKNKDILVKRKGTMLKTLINRGQWWALLGVGEYCFYPYKIVWEAYGKSDFKPLIFEGKWQANQSLHAYIPVKSIEEAKRIQKELCNKDIENYLLSLKMEGTMNWAQPGKIKKFIEYRVDTD
jgi:hypothetical protein